MEGYSVNIKFASKELSAKQKVMLKDTTNALSLDELTQPKPITNEEGEVIRLEPQTVTIDPDFYVTLMVHNEKAEDKDYEKHVIEDKSGTKYVTGSASFITSFVEIMEEMSGSDEEFQIEVYRMPSKNYKGKEFLTCSIV